MRIRQAELSDALPVARLLSQLGYPGIDENLAREKIQLHRADGYQLLVAEIDAQVVAFIALHWFELMHWKGKMGRMTAFCVDENFRSQGVGKLLLKASEEILKNKGCVKFEVTSNARRIRTHEFYLSNGYVEDSRRFVKYQ